MPTEFTNQRRPLPPSLAAQLSALGVDPEQLQQFTEQVELQHQLLAQPEIKPDINPDTDIV